MKLPIFGTFIQIQNHGKKHFHLLRWSFWNFVDDKISTGRFQNASEVIRAGLRLLEEEETKIVALRIAIEEGIDSGYVKNFDPKKHLEKLKLAKRKNG